ncbi:MAG: tRNA (N6-isopentenyl adenosine(37)-C2)-methylthiotransferase MiaB [Candidatus Aminicenantes bacterium]|nr:tRNA (N6-isopentenyl adenosine(37)-C2)-methylthiotransferase MiaB [Candidatus Aminicenantes bacterium]
MSANLAGLSYFIRTFGCQMNENDSERIAGLLEAEGAVRAERAEASDIVIVNTCSVRAKAEEKLFSYLGRLSAPAEARGAVVGVVGCTAQVRRTAFWDKPRRLHFVLGPGHYELIPDIVRARRPGRVCVTSRHRQWREWPAGRTRLSDPWSAYVTIMEGCDNFCAYCVVPFARGREKYRPFALILDEIRSLAGRGVREIQLLGQNVNAYRDPGAEGRGLAELLDAVSAQEGVEWIRFLASHPRTFSAEVARAMARNRKVCRQLHLPVQSGSDTVLARMGRGYGRQGYLDKVRQLRDLMPDIQLSADIIVGYPGETDAEFAETLSLLEEVRFANIFSFRYSPRPFTAASRGPDDVPAQVKKARLTAVQALQKAIQAEQHRDFLGRTLTVLLRGRDKRDARGFAGRSEGNQVVNFRSRSEPAGPFVRVRVTGSGPYSLKGERVEPV